MTKYDTECVIINETNQIHNKGNDRYIKCPNILLCLDTNLSITILVKKPHLARSEYNNEVEC